ncbi:hypothetical protein MHU86_3650 [Fragilaria crotonensis]|nr:hypothetical protein MHU86_3650 [Fragilaria crotonensis]
MVVLKTMSRHEAGRWRKHQVVDRYIDVNLPYPDARVASVLAMGGPIKYSLKNQSGVTEAWLLDNVVPNMFASRNLHQQVSLVLAFPLLWAAFDPDMEHFMPASLRSRIRAAYEKLETRLPDGENPVRKILIVVTGQDDEVHINEVFADENGTVNGEGGYDVNVQNNGVLLAGQDYQLRAIYSQLNVLRREIHLGLEQIGEGQDQRFRDINEKLDHLRRNIRRVAQQPVQRPRDNDNGNARGAGEIEPRAGLPLANATLSRTPRSLHVLWCEYEMGIGGRKAAREFTSIERGRVKCVYCKRKVVWDKIAEMIRAGHSAQVAIDMIYHAYGAGTSVTEIIKLMRRDNAAGGGHPYLRVL